MANRIPEKDLEDVMRDAGLSSRTKSKLRDANKEPAKTIGHGAPGESRMSFGSDGL